jgi:DNA-binding CsgD family transcriptional regulator
MNKKQHPYYKHLLVSECGRIFSTLRGREVELKQYFNKGYVSTNVNLGVGINKQRRVHRLVAETYLPNPENLREVDHIDCNKLNNHVSNLEWVSSKENKRRAWENGLYTMRGEDHCGAILTEEIVRSICQLLQDGMRNKEVAEQFSLHKDAIGHIKRGTIWQHISKDYNLTVARKERKPKELVIRVCELISEGHSDADIIKTFNIKISKQDLQRIRAKQIFKSISDSYF